MSSCALVATSVCSLSTREARKLNDSELDSGDDEGRDDRAVAEQEDVMQNDEQEELTFMDAALARHHIPNPSDGEVSQPLKRFWDLQTNTVVPSSTCSKSPASLVLSQPNFLQTPSSRPLQITTRKASLPLPSQHTIPP